MRLPLFTRRWSRDGASSGLPHSLNAPIIEERGKLAGLSYNKDSIISEPALFNTKNMYTLIYLNGKFNRPDTLSQFLLSNVGETPLVQIDCITPYIGTESELIEEVCNYLSRIERQINVSNNCTQNVSMTELPKGHAVNYIVMQLSIVVNTLD